ncbi:major intrinsically disordered NOTCH2-binding receptor 1-like [Ahaetulla prasina]|uniref:major intrinsically disordered NOTCH2-binding receptor 1-like n=1 Tax=Ahaetulla prasina TaxID=499056 RepID=UPI0026492735|nr:major intrinsically disordered NOTCH2-binding receptor 1-like [Ahaetulla prasina]
MDFSALPNNNNPDKFLQLEVKSLAKTSAFLQTWLANFPEPFPQEQKWHNRVYSQREKKNIQEQPVWQLAPLHTAMIDKAIGKHVTPVTLKSTIKSNPLYDGILADDCWEKRRHNPSWTVQEYDRHSNSSLPHYLKENPNDLQYWMEDIYTPGYDTLLKKKAREGKRSRHCLIMLLVLLAELNILFTIILLLATFFLK